jgi:membrane protease YdiL (CAAX protease family)
LLTQRTAESVSHSPGVEVTTQIVNLARYGLVFSTMTFADRLWLRLPVVVRAVFVGVAAATAGTLPWAALVAANTRYRSAVPWAVPIMAIYLWVYWRYFVRGTGWPRSTAERRRLNARANGLDPDTWGPALLAGLLGLVSVLLFQGVLSRLVALPRQRGFDISQYPTITVLLWILMSAVVSGVVEETSFRGYLQGPIERRHGPVMAILITGVLFGFVHFSHPEVGVVLLPFYLAVAAVYGALAHVTDSTLPGMVLHAGGNMFSAFDLFTRGRSEWQLSSEPMPLIWETGPDAAFWGNAAALVIAVALTVGAFSALARATRNTR